MRYKLIPDELEKIANNKYTLMEFSHPQLSIEQIQGPGSTQGSKRTQSSDYTPRRRVAKKVSSGLPETTDLLELTNVE